MTHEPKLDTDRDRALIGAAKELIAAAKQVVLRPSDAGVVLIRLGG